MWQNWPDKSLVTCQALTRAVGSKQIVVLTRSTGVLTPGQYDNLVCSRVVFPNSRLKI